MAQLAWVTGAQGLIGSHIVRAARQWAAEWEIRPLARTELDLCDRMAVEKAFQSHPPDLIIHCAALSRSPDCQKDPALAWRVNVESTRHLAQLAAERPFIFFSTDLVFDGREGNYSESSAVHPLSVYAETKAAAEHVVLANPRHTVVRTSLNGGWSPTGDRGFNEQLRAAWGRGDSVRLFTDEFRSPIVASVTARAIWEIVAQRLAGLYHVAGSERLSRARIGQLVAARWPQLHPRIELTSLKAYAGAPRPPDTSLDCSKVQKALSFRLPGLSEWLEAHPAEVF